MEKYIVIYHPSGKTKSKMGRVWEQKEDEKFYCKEELRSLEKWQIESDMKNGYLKEYKEL